MKKPTFSSFRRSLLILLNVLFLSDSFLTDSFFKVFQNFRSLSFYKVGTSAIQNKLTVGFVVLFFFNSSIIFGQNLKAFTPSRFDTRLKGDMLLIGNNILNRNERRNERPNDAYNGNGYNSDFSMEYINVDSDGGKNFNSSTAKLTIPKPACYKVVYAGLYWGAILQQTDRSNIEKVRLKLPNATSYTDITGSIVYDANSTPIGSGNNKPYACYADITSLVKGLSDAQGNYTVANVISSTGSNGTTGLSAGWSIFVVYEDPTLPAKYITTFDGFSGIGGPTTLDIPISGFKTIPTGPVRVKFAFSALEGDQQISGDYLQINGTAVSATNSAGTVIRGTNNFFNSSVTYIDPATGITENFLNRTPASSNTLGYDAGILNIDNPNNGIIANDATSAKITLGSTQDVYFYYFNAFAVDIIEPKIVLTKVVKNDKNQDIGNQNVTLGQILNYEIELQNIGNDNATSLTIRDVLPINTIFNYPADPSSVTLPTGITVKSYNSSTREIVFDVNKSIVEVGDGKSKILLKVQVVPSCNMLSDACSNSIDNQAFATYKGTLNTDFTISDDPSINTNTGCLLVPKATNFLVGVDDCKFTKNEVLCGNSVVITAANGYNSYKWSTAPFDNTGNTTGTILGSNQTLTVTNPGTYYVYNTAIAPCLSITEAVTVSRFGGIVTNPVIPFADQWVTCPNDGKQLPNIFLCGLNATRAINTNISDGSTIVWEKLNEASCTAVSNQNCANENSSCTWTQVETGASYTANTSGQFRLTLNYPGGCFNRFYFNVYQNLLNPTETHRDIICNTKGNITIGGVPSGYEYSIDGTNYQASNSFTINTAGLYTVYIRQVGVTSNPCIFKVPNIQIRQRNFTVSTTVTQPLCFGEKGSIKVAANDVEPQYNFKIFNGGTLVNSVGPTTAGDYTFSNLTPGITYQVQVTTQDGCSNDQWIYISQPSSAVTANAAIVEPLTACNDGKIVITTQGGTGPYYYFVNGSSTFQTSNEIIVTTPGKYDILVVDSKNCSGTATVTVPDNSKPTYTIGNTNSTCYGNGSQITIGNIVANGYTMSYSIDNGATFSSNPVFSNLYPGTYNVVVKYTITYMSQWNGQQTKTCQDPAVTATITGPTSAVSASAGVGELAGCGPLQGGQPTGLLRITNVQGGTAPYQYSYDGGNTWEASSQKYVVAGTYSLAVKDALGCTYQIPYSVILDPKPADPVIQDNVNTIYNCDGTASATVIVNNPSSSGGTTYTYQYYLDNVLNTNTPTNTFLNVPSGSHTVKVKYDVSTVSSYSNLLSEDFGRGDDTTSPGINSAYCWEKQDGNTLAFATCSLNDWHPWLMNDGDYVVTKALLPDHFNDFNWWLPKDHTAVLNNTPGITDGRFLAVNIGATIPIGAVLYSKPINDVIPNQSINVSLYMANLLKASNNLPSPQLRVQLVKNGTVIASQAMPDIPRDEKWHFSTDLTGSVLTLNPGNNTSLDFQIISNSQVVTGNDLAIDDIQVYQIPKSCGNEREFPIIIDGSKAFKASLPSFSNPKCNGGNDGTITIAAENFNTTTGYQYNIDGGTFQTTTVSPFVLTGIGVGSHTIVVRNDATGTCSYTLNQAITSPTAVTVTASVTTLPTCTTGATITAIGSGGTPGYEFELRASDGTTVITGFQTSGIFTNVASGNYKVFVRDANLCTGSGTGVAVSVTAPSAPTATLDTATDYCYTTADPAKLVVKVTGGLAPYTYTTTFNGGTPSAVSPTFAGPTFTYTATAPGTYTFDVYDANGCKANSISQVINDELTVATPVTTGLDCDAAPSNQAVITGTISGGKAPFVVTLVSGTGGTLVQPVGNGNTFTYSNAVAGTYGFQVKDANNCLATSSQKIDPLVPITLGSTNISPKCNGGSDGSIQLNPSGGSGGFTYSKDGITYDNTSLFTGLSAGVKYTYYVQDSNKCIKSIDVTLAAPSTISATAAITTPYTCDGPAVISVTSISGGKGPYNYTLNRGATVVSSNTSGVFSGISVVGNYTVTITDANGCPATATPSLTISALNGPTDLTFTYKSFDCSTNTSAFNVNLPSSGGGQPPIRFQIIALPASIAVGSPLYNYLTQDHPDGQYSGVPAGVYTFEVTDKNNCKYQEVYELVPEPPIVVSGSVLNNVKCFGTATGSVEFSVSGFATTYSYTINNGASSGFVSNPTITLTNLAAGDYTISVTDKKTGCVRTAKVSVLAPPTELKIDSIGTTPITCLSNATVTINTVGGWGSNTYTVTGTAPVVAPVTQSTNSFIISAPGNYKATVTDMNGCSVTQNFTIANKVNPVASIDPSSDYCYDSTDKATLIVTPNANPNYVYNINNGTFQSTGTFANLTPGAYVIRVKDITTGCILPLASETIASQVSAGTAITKNLDCTSSPNAIIKVTVANGYPDYSYRVSTDGTFTGAKTPLGAGVTTFNYTTTHGPGAATYSFEITDAKGCVTIITQSINAIVFPTATTNPTNPTCFGNSNGSVLINASLGIAPYSYEVSTVSSTGPFVLMASNLYSNAAAGDHWFRVTDAKSCTFTTGKVTLTAPVAVTATAAITTAYTCDNPAVISVTSVSGGTAPYNYTLNRGGVAIASNTTGVFNNISVAGNYTVTVTDSNSCPFTTTPALIITALNPPKNPTFNERPISCKTGESTSDVTVKVAVGTGTLPLKYEITDPASAISNITGATSGIFTGLTPGTYTFKVTDANNCSVTGVYKVDDVLPVLVNGSVVSNVSCLNSTDGKLSFTVSGNSGTFSYVLKNSLNATIPNTQSSQTGNVIDFAGLAADTYKITITNPTTGCTATKSLTVAAPTAVLDLDPTTLVDVTCNAKGSAVINAKGGWGSYTYAVTPTNPTGATISQNNKTFTNLSAGDYSFIVTDLNGCQVNGIFTIKDKVLPTASIDATSIYCAGGAGATLKVTPNAQTNYTYTLGGTVQSNGTFSGLAPGKYTIRVTDTSTGCYIDLPEQTIALPLTASTKLLADLDCEVPPASPDASIEVTINDGYPNYSYKVNQTGAPFTGAVNLVTGAVFTYTAATARTYYFEITDSKGCTTVVSRTINTLVKPTIASAVPAAVKCNGGSTGTITVTPSAVGLYTYVLTPIAPTGPVVSQSTNVFSNLKAGQYDVVIIDAKNCSSAAVSVTVTEPIALAASATLKTALKCGAGNAPQAATIEVTATDGTPFAGLDQYRYDYGDGNGFVTSNTFISSTSGATINITVKDANGCTVTTSATVNAFNPPSPALAFAQANPISCDATKLDTDLKLTVTNGVAPFTFEITGTDAATPPTTTVANGILTQDYTFADLFPGTYSFKVTDANGCTSTGQYKIDDVKKLTVTAVKLSDNKCINVDGGSAKFTVADNTGAINESLINTITGISYSYASLSGNVYTYTNLPAGDYTFTAVDGTTKCSKNGTVTINNPAGITIATPVATKVFCSKPSSTITISATGGTGTLYYAVVKQGVTPVYPTDYNTTGIFSKNTITDATLIYDVYVQDANGCPKQTTVTVPRDNAPTVNLISDSCYPGSSFTVTVGGLVYTGSSTKYGLGTTATNIVYNGTASKTISAPGTYFVGIKDDNGCEATTSFTVRGQLIITSKLDKDLTCTSTPLTFGAAQITLSSVGGNSSYAYEYSTDGITYTPFAGNVYNPTTAGDYYFRVTSGGCSAATAVPVKVTNPVNPDITSIIQTQFIKCSGDETAAIKINLDLTKGIPAFVFKVERYADNTYTDPAVHNYGTQTTGLAAGFYKVTVTDAKGCTDTDFIEIKGKDPITFDDLDLTIVPITCNNPGGSTSGSITIANVQGGTASPANPFTYYITNNFGVSIPPYTASITGREDHTFAILDYGVYTITAVDANGCSFSRQTTMASPPSDLTIDVTSVTSDCTNGGTAKVEAISTLGSGNYEFGILETNTSPYTSTWYTPDVVGGNIKTFTTNLVPGVTYTFVVHDKTTNCYFVKTADQPILPASSLTSTVVAKNVTCKNLNDGDLTFTVENYDSSTTSVDYSIFSAYNNVQIYPPVIPPALPTSINVSVPIAAPGTIDPPVALAPGRYYIKFIERGGTKDGCMASSDIFEIKESSVELSVIASVYKNENCNELGIITAEAKDGTGSYEYLVNTTNVMPVATTSGWQTSNTFNLAANIAGDSYYVFAKDANGCIKPAAAVTLVKDPDPVFALNVPNKCAGEGNFAVDVTITDSTPSMAPYSVSVNTSSFVSFSGLTYTATGLNSGTQTIIIQDKNGCPVTHTIDINATPTATAEVSPVLVCTPPTVADATITVTIDKGTKPYTYQAYKNNAAVLGPVTLNATDVTFNYPVASADFGTYKFLITDANSCPIETNEVIVDPIVPIVPDFKATQPLCHGGSGTIELSATGGKGPYTYDFNGLGFSTQTVYTVSAGTYPFVVKDALGCIENGSAVLGEPTVVTLNALVPGVTLIQPTCGPLNAAVDAKVVLSATGGTGTYTYSFDGSTFDGQDTYLVSQPRAGVAIPYSVKDGNGCIDTGSVTIDKLDPPVFDLNAFTQSTVTCKTPTSDVQVVSTNGFGGVTYSIVSPASETGNITGAISGQFTGLPAGDYIFKVTDSKGCTDEVPYTVKDVIKINIALQSTTGITCSTATDGKASFFISGYGSAAPGTYHYILDTNPPVTLTAATINLIGLTSGNHIITVVDDVTGCSMTLPGGFDIAAPPAPLTISKVVTPRGCTTFGAVVVTGHDGWGNYTYTLTPPTGLALTNNDGIFNGLTDLGHYDISVSDANGCPATDSFDLAAPTPPIATVDMISDYCYDNTNAATLVVKASAGVAPYLFSIDNGVTFLASNSLPLPNDTYTFNGLTPGSYDIVVQDAYGCKSGVPVNTVIEPQLFAKAENIKDIFCTVGNENGTIRISAQGGYGSYSYTVTKDTDPTSAPIAFGAGLDTVDYSVTASGSYVFVVTDAKGCSYTIANTVVMVDPTPVTYTAVPTSPSCTGSQGNMSDGSILVTLGSANDNPDYTYTIVRTSPAGFTATQVNNGLFTGLTAGDYSITVTSAKGCSTPDTVTINPPAAVTASASAPAFSCTVDPTKTVVTVVGGGGTGTYTFSKDGTNYFASNSVPADNKYAFDLVDNASTQNPTYWVKDSSGCVQSTTLPAPIDPLPKLMSATASQVTKIDCVNGAESIKIDVVGGSIPSDFKYEVSIDGAAFTVLTPSAGASFNYSALLAEGKNYQFRITDNVTGCSILSNAYYVPLFNKINVFATASANVKCKSETNGAIEINVTGYSGTYNYEVYDGGTLVTSGLNVDTATSNPFVIPFGFGAGTAYTVKVIETAFPSCSTTSNVVVITEPALALTISNDVTPLGCTIKGAVAINAKDGWGSYTYMLTTPTGTVITQSNNYFGNLSDTSGVYTTSVTDANGCTVTDKFTLTIPANPTVTVLASDYCYDDSNKATLVVQASLGVAPYLFSIDNGQTFVPSNSLPLPNDTYTFSNLAPGSYDIVVKDAYGCPSMVPVNEVVKPQLFASAVKTKDIDCAVSPNGTIKISATGGYGPYSYKVSTDNGVTFSAISTGFTNPSDTDFSVPVSGVPVSYVFEITDSKGCVFVTTPPVLMTPPTAVDVLLTDISTTPVDCNTPQGTDNNGTITVNLRAFNDNPDYTYTLTPVLPAGSPIVQVNNSIFTGLKVGDYTVTVTSGRGCSSLPIPVKINPVVPVTASASAPAFSCAVDPTKTVVTVVGGGGTGTYTFSKDGVNYFTSNSSPTADNKYAFDLVDNASTQNPTYWVKDSNGCVQSTTLPAPIDPLPKLVSATASQVTKIDCVNGAESIKIDVVGGSIPSDFKYEVSIDGAAFTVLTPSAGASFNYSALTAGSNYQFRITDNVTGCNILSNAYYIPLFNKMKVFASAAANVDCNGNATGAIEINITDYAGPYNYEILKGGVPLVPAITGSGDSSVTSSLVLPSVLKAGTDYTVVVTQGAYPRCTVSSANVIITEPAVLDLSGLKVSVKNQNCNTTGAVLTIDETTIVGGVFGGHTYAFVAAGGTPVYGPSNTITISTTKVAPLFDAYDVYVKDANGCFDHVTVNISQDPMPTVTASVASQCADPAGYTIKVDSSTGVGPFEYSLDGNSWQTANSFNVNSSGNYTVTVRDVNKCTATSNMVTILKPLQLSADITTSPTCTNADGVVTLTVSGGSIPANYQYSKDGVTYGSSNIFNGLAPASYTFYVKDMVTNCTKSVAVLIETPNTTIDFSSNKTDVSCKGGSDGLISISLAPSTLTVNNNPPYKFSLAGTTVNSVAVSRPLQDSNVFDNLQAGNYVVTIISSKGCQATTSSIEVKEPLIITVPNPAVAPFGCTSGNAMNFATITVNGVTGGTGSYSIYEFFKNGISVQRGANNVYTEADLAGGTYTVTVYDSKGCQGSTAAPIVIAPFISLDKINIAITKAITCNNSEDITVSATTTGGTPAVLNYTVAGTGGNVYNQTKTTGIFTGLTVGDYVITVANPATGCSITSVHYVNAPNTFELKAVKTSDVKCYGSNEGAVQLTVVDTQLVPTNDAGAFIYTLTRPNGTTTNGNSATAGPLTLSGLTAGAYKVTATLTNSPFCSVTTNFTIDQPSAPLTVTETHTAITCIAGNNDGTISAVATGGWSGGYEFQLELASGTVIRAWATSPDFTGLVAGSYIVKARDTKLCVRQVSVPLVNPTPITVTATPSVTKVSCFGDKSATITAAANGGQGSNYLYTLNYTSLNPVISSGPQSSPVFTGLGAGSYSITVTDGWSCSVTSTVVTINEPTEVQANLVLASSQTCQTQSRLTLSATGGTAPYRYSATSNIATSVAMVGNSVTFPVGNGTFHYYVWDANGCASYISNDIQNDPLEPLAVGLDVENAVINCRGDLSGVIVAEAKGGLGNYVYTLVNGSGVAITPAPVQSTPGRFEGLAAGTYKVSVTSGDCNIVSVAVTIIEPLTALTATPTVVNVTCNGNNNGEITINASGGTGIIKYAISPNLDQFFVTNKFVNLKPGFYDVIAQDENGCYVYMKNVQISEPNPITVNFDPLSIKQELCSGDKTGEFIITIGGGTAPFSTSIDDGPFVPNRVSFTGLSGGKHKVIVKDANLCDASLDVPLNPAVTLNPTAVVSNDCVNDLPANKVTVTVDPSNNPADVKYSLDNSPVFQSSNVFTNIDPGDHFIMVEHKNGCADATAPFKINKVDPLTISLSLGGLNEIVATVTGGSGVYQFTVNGEAIGSNNKYIYFRSGDYTVTVSDSYGCSVSATKYFEFIDIKIPPIFTPNGDGENDNWKPTNTENYPDIKFIIYDRYGRQVGVFGAGQSWDGKYNGTELPMGDYWYILKLRHAQDDREFVGHFTLYR